jgi:hypothetical protein
MKALPFIAAVLATLVKCAHLALASQWLLTLGWLVAGSWIALIGYMYWKNLDLPMVGPADYREGKNQSTRTIAAIGMTFIYVIAVASGK